MFRIWSFIIDVLLYIDKEITETHEIGHPFEKIIAKSRMINNQLKENCKFTFVS